MVPAGSCDFAFVGALEIRSLRLRWNLASVAQYDPHNRFNEWSISQPCDGL